jgi:bacterioferritin
MECDFSCEALNRYRVDLPYPEVAVERPNFRYAAIVSGAYGGRGSEMTAITQYTVHRFFIEQYPDLAEAYRYIAITEMEHFELLGSLIKRLGRPPVVKSYETNQFWSGSFPDYQYRLGAIIQSDIQGEKDAIAHYQRIIRSVDDAGIQNLMRRIILDEEKHIEILTKLYKEYVS